MQVSNKAYLIIPVLFLLSIQTAYSSSGIVVEFLYYDACNDPKYNPDCPKCVAECQDFKTKNETITRIVMDYHENLSQSVTLKALEWTSTEGFEERRVYTILGSNWLVIKADDGNFTVIGEDIGTPFNETQIREAIDGKLPAWTPPNLWGIIWLAFTFGFFETFSPCLMVLLSFVLSYSLEKSAKFRDGVFQVGSFGIGFTGAALSLGIAVGMLSLGIGSFTRVTALIVCIFAIVFGLYQMNIFKKTPIETKPMVKNLAKKYALTYGGLVLLGFAFYFLDPCLAPIFFAMLPIMMSQYLPLILLSFAVGVIVPFVFIGFLSGSISRFVRTTYRHKEAIRAISGLILVGYGIYLLITFFV